MRSSPALALLTAVTLLAVACEADTDAPSASPSASAPDTPAASTSPAPPAAPSPSVAESSPAGPSPTPTAAAAPDPTTVHTEPGALAETLVAAEQAIRDPQLDPAAVTGWAWAQQAAYRQLAARPEWHEPVRARVPAPLHATFDRNLEATVELRELTSPREELPAWRIVPPPPAEELLGYYRAAADEFGMDWTYLAAIHLVETRMGRIRGTSTAGARGPMQFIPPTWEAYGEGDIEDPKDAIRTAARYLADHGAPQDMSSALYAYNHSDRYVTAVADHAAVMREDPRAYYGYHQWQVYYRLSSGDVVLEEGWDNTG